MQLYTLSYPSQFCGLGSCNYICYLTRLSSVGWAHSNIYTNLPVSVLWAGPMQLYILTILPISVLWDLPTPLWAHVTIYTDYAILWVHVTIYTDYAILWVHVTRQLYRLCHPLGPCNYIYCLLPFSGPM